MVLSNFMIYFSKTRVKEERQKKLRIITLSLKGSLDQTKNKNEELEREITEYGFNTSNLFTRGHFQLC